MGFLIHSVRFHLLHDRMTVALAANAPACFDIKSAQLPLVALRVKSARLDEVADALSTHYADVPEFLTALRC